MLLHPLLHATYMQFKFGSLQRRLTPHTCAWETTSTLIIGKNLIEKRLNGTVAMPVYSVDKVSVYLELKYHIDIV